MDKRGSRLRRLLGLRFAAAVAIGLACAVSVAAAPERHWQPLAKDGEHDPTGPGIGVLQEPAAALSQLPADTPGNQVRWVKAIEGGYITPRSRLSPKTKVTKVLDLDVILKNTGVMPMVRFPHKIHTEWLDCQNCHEEIFAYKAGATPINMFAILQGEYCGRCHGAVAFPLSECNRCHSVPHKD